MKSSQVCLGRGAVDGDIHPRTDEYIVVRHHKGSIPVLDDLLHGPVAFQILLLELDTDDKPRFLSACAKETSRIRS